MQVQQLHRACGESPAEAEVLVFVDGKLRDITETKPAPGALLLTVAAATKAEPAAEVESPKVDALSSLAPMRTIDTHKVNGLNEALELEVLDGPGAGGASHLYRIKGKTPFGDSTIIAFQNGPIKEAGFNGLSQEVLLAIVVDRLESFQWARNPDGTINRSIRGPHYCKSNDDALGLVRAALTCLKNRTKIRIEQGVEGTHAPHVDPTVLTDGGVSGMATDGTPVTADGQIIEPPVAPEDTPSTPPPAENPVTEPTPPDAVPAPAPIAEPKQPQP